jgi:hypothetical protein
MHAAFTDLENLRLDELCTARNAAIFQVIREFEHARNEAVAQPAHAPQHCGNIDSQPLCSNHAEGLERLAPVKCAGRFDQRFRRHAPNARAGSAV